MQSKVKKVIIASIVVMIVGGIGIKLAKNIYNNSPVEFKDETMKNVIVESCAKQSGVRGTTRGELKGVGSLTTGFVGYYDTLEDIKWCTDMKKLDLNSKIGEYDYEPAYQIAQGELPEELTEEKINQFEAELGEILPKLRELKEVRMVSNYGCKWNTLDFLKRCDQIEVLLLYDFNVADYSVLKQCKSLKEIAFWDCPISKAEDLIGLENLEYIGMSGVPLAENPEELKKLQEAYPNAEIFY